MKLYRRCFLIVLLIFIPLYFFTFSSIVKASFIDNLVGDVKNIISPSQNLPITINSKVSLTPDGDANKNGAIDSGDIVRFTYTVNNPSTNEYIFTKFKTGIKNNVINNIHNITGVTGLEYEGGNLTLLNISLKPDQVLELSFDARLNYNDSDSTLFSEPELFDNKGKSLLKGKEVSINVKGIDKSKFPSYAKFNIPAKGSQ